MRLLRLLPGLCLLVVGCHPAPPPNLLLVTFDTTRADFLGCYGRASARTPTLDALASKGVLFEQCRSAVPLTMPSHSTMMTGLYPVAHGVRDNGLFRLPQSRTTLAEILRGRGYATGAAVGSFILDHQFGISQGFDFYDDRLGREYENFWGRRTVDKPPVFYDERPAERTNAAILPWLRKNWNRPFFAWIHYWDPHEPHAPPAPYNVLFANDLYQGEIAYADDALGHVLQELEAAGVAGRTLIVMLSDHGEGRYEHNESTHSILCYDATLHVPLIVKGPGVAAGKRVRERVGTVDLLPTVLDLLGAPPRTDVHGRSLASLWRGGERGEDRHPYYSETLAPRLSHGLGELRVWFEGPFKYIHGPRPELYDLRADAGENRDLIGSDPGTAAGMRERLSRFIAQTARPPEDAAVPGENPENVERLAALGYVSSGQAAPGDVKDTLRSDGTPPQDRIGYFNRIGLVKDMLIRNRHREAKDMAEELLQSSPEDPLYTTMAAWAELGLGQTDAALKRLERAELAPLSFARWLYPIIDRLAQTGNPKRALALIDRALAKDQGVAAAHALRADILRQLGREDDYIAGLRDALKVDPGYYPARLELGVVLAQRGELVQAQEQLEAVLRQQPLNPRAHFNYATLLTQLGRWQEARRHFARALELDANYWKGYTALMATDLELGDRSAAAAVQVQLKKRCQEAEVLQEAEALMNPGGSAAP